MFSKEGPYLSKPDVTSKPKVIPNRYKEMSKKIKGIPSLRTETPNNGIAIKTAGIILLEFLK